MQKFMFRFFDRTATVCWVTSPWHCWQSTPARICGACPEPHVFRRIEPVHRLPGDVLFFGRVSSKFLDLRIVGGDLLVTRHAEADAGYSSVRSFRHPHMATRTLHAVLKMKLMIKCDWLRRSRLQLKVFFDGIDEGLTARFEYWREICGHGCDGCFGCGEGC